MKMNISVIVNAKGEIVGAAIPSEPRPTVGPGGVDELKLPEDHTIHELSMPSELAKAFVDGKFTETFQHYKLIEEAGKVTLKRA
jgi:hypothetical protein